ncbi:hypothetical protein V0288_11210 [Pannus brasiliensis CCIBt3594]|uniref:Uncharacterized protein n=1 Tax=Pannus brasiliensis CCIBt3594 TaxID=1427578 RepID=A0AAW9QVM1_9CHRO
MIAFRTIANKLKIPESTVSFWNNKGILPKSEDICEIAAWIIEYYKGQLEEEKAKKSGKGGQSAYFEEKTRLTSAQADKVELENAVRAGELFEVAAAERAWEDYIGRCRKRLLGLPAKAAAELAAMSDPIAVQEYLKDRVDEALWELSRIDFEDEGESSESEGEARAEG